HSRGHFYSDLSQAQQTGLGAVGRQSRRYGAGNMSGRWSRDKGARTERAIVRLGADLHVAILGVARAVEVKCRAAGFSRLHGWLKRQEPLVAPRTSLAAEIAKGATP